MKIKIKKKRKKLEATESGGEKLWLNVGEGRQKTAKNYFYDFFFFMIFLSVYTWNGSFDFWLIKKALLINSIRNKHIQQHLK